MADDNKNLASDTERTSILPQSELQAADQTDVLPIHASEAETAQMPPVAQQEGAGAFADTPLGCVAGSSIDDQASDEAVAARAVTVEPASKKTSWGKRAAIAGAAAALLSVGFGAGIITHAAILGDGEDFYEQGYEDGYNDQGYGDEDEDWESNSGGTHGCARCRSRDADGFSDRLFRGRRRLCDRARTAPGAALPDETRIRHVPAGYGDNRCFRPGLARLVGLADAHA